MSFQSRMHFDFIAEEGVRRPRKDQATKHLIRKRATQAAAMTKRREGTIKRTNALQLPPWAIHAHSGAHETDQESESALLPNQPAFTIINNVQLNTNYFFPHELVEVPCGPCTNLPPVIFTQDIPALLSTPAVQEHLAGSLLNRFPTAKDKMRIAKLLKLSDHDFLLQLSTKYGQSAALDAAIACLVARIKEFLGASSEAESPRLLYGRALQVLQNGLTDSKETLENLWYATPTLALFELLDATSHTPWILHTKGAIRLLERLGAQNIISESQKTLLATQTPIMIIEAFATAGSCFLDEAEWQQALQKCIHEGPTFSFRTEMIINLFLMVSHLPNLLNRITDIIRTTDTSQVASVQQGLLDLKSRFALWNARWASILNMPRDDSWEEGKRRFHRSNSYGYVALINRMLLALDPSQCLDLEAEALENARRAAGVANVDADVRLAYARIVSKSIADTSSQWQEHCMFSDEPLVSKSVFLEWMRILERPVEVS